MSDRSGMKRTGLKRKALRAVAVLAGVALSGVAGSAWADDASATPSASSDAAAATSGSKWKIGVGPGLIITPQYPGSGTWKYYPYPALDISYDDRFFSQGPDVLGVNFLRSEAGHLGMAITFDLQSRNSRDDPHLHGLPDVQGGPKLKLFADYTWTAITGALAAYQDIAGNRQGLTATADLYASLPVGGWLFSVGPGVTWASATYNRTFFEVSPQSSAASGLPTYGTSAGLRDIHMNAFVSYTFSRHWSASAAATFGKLEHNAGNSPITERRFELNVLSSVSYRF